MQLLLVWVWTFLLPVLLNCVVVELCCCLIVAVVFLIDKMIGAFNRSVASLSS